MLINNYCCKEQKNKLNNLEDLEKVDLLLEDEYYKILVREIEKRIIPVEELTKKKQKLYHSDDLTIRDCLKDLFQSNFDNDD